MMMMMPNSVGLTMGEKSSHGVWQSVKTEHDNMKPFLGEIVAPRERVALKSANFVKRLSSNHYTPWSSWQCVCNGFSVDGTNPKMSLRWGSI